MESLKEVSDQDLDGITTPLVTNIIANIKKIQRRMKDPELENMSLIDRYTLLTTEFTDFATNYGTIFSKVVGKEDLSTVAAILYYKDKEQKGLISEESVFKLVSDKYLSEDVKKKIKEAENAASTNASNNSN